MWRIVIVLFKYFPGGKEHVQTLTENPLPKIFEPINHEVIGDGENYTSRRIIICAHHFIMAW